MSGVRNLRAMFEQKGDGLPDRGRSPGPGGFGSDSPSASPRPLSKVRTSFVAVEKDGRIGLRREPSEDSVSVSSRRKFSNDTDTTSERPDIFSDKMTSTAPPFKTNLSHEAIPESPSQDTPVKSTPKKDLKGPPVEPNANPDKVIDEEEPRTKMLASNPTESSATRLGGTVLNEGIGDALNGTPSPTTKAKTAGPTKPAAKTVAPISTAKTTIKATKSPLTTKAANGKEPIKPANSSTATKKATATTTATKTATSKPAPINLAPSSTGFVKPKVKSPTRPVKLPSTLTTHTASSAQKQGNGSTAPGARQTLSRASGNAQHLSVDPTSHRSPSRNSVSTTGTTTKTLKHKPSTVGRSSRPSLGPPPKPEAKTQPATKRESQVDEGFLARMMRPTQSSAKKTSDKAPLTPPRKQNPPVKKPDPKDTEKNAKKVAAKIQASSAKAKTAKDDVKSVAAKEQPTAKDIVPAVAKAETAEAAIESAKLSTETAEAPLVQDEKTEVEPTAKEVGAVVAQEETAEAIIETAKTSEETASTTNVPSTEESKVVTEPVVEEEAVPESIVEEDAVPEPIVEEEAVLESNIEEEITSEPRAEVEVVPEPDAEVDVTKPVGVISEDPLKVEDIEDTVREAQDPIHQAESTNATAEASQPEDVPETNGSVAISTEEAKEESKADAQEAKEEPLKVDETSVDVEKTASEQVKTENPTTANVPLDTKMNGVEETAAKDLVDATP
ncbi:hypothetical protein F5B22DRAFT_612786 [Xylaria bambusicola]|uniref:uncharacterized protein n=1 Tax=Xylaria bambusicola TaxID=326684 RepID=UPI0020077BCF|nr:uncharacterized protein F5B22DRAFT_612786 [Xylaria bambusicola]KAI0512950.1 hypothetical protein F5B22DRAFT_612786 [Xylaria bambusicola]